MREMERETARRETEIELREMERERRQIVIEGSIRLERQAEGGGRGGGRLGVGIQSKADSR